MGPPYVIPPPLLVVPIVTAVLSPEVTGGVNSISAAHSFSVNIIHSLVSWNYS